MTWYVYAIDVSGQYTKQSQDSQYEAKLKWKIIHQHVSSGEERRAHNPEVRSTDTIQYHQHSL